MSSYYVFQCFQLARKKTSYMILKSSFNVIFSEPMSLVSNQLIHLCRSQNTEHFFNLFFYNVFFQLPRTELIVESFLGPMINLRSVEKKIYLYEFQNKYSTFRHNQNRLMRCITNILDKQVKNISTYLYSCISNSFLNSI